MNATALQPRDPDAGTTPRPARRPWRRPTVTIAVIEQVTRNSVNTAASDGTPSFS